MVSVTNNISDFFENKDGEIVIYGAGNSGYWLGYYMNKCDVSFSFYVDKKAESSRIAEMNNHPIYPLDKLKEFKGRQVRIIIAANTYESMLSELLFADTDNSYSILCLVPRFRRVTGDVGPEYNINRLLGYFRHKLLHGDMPSIIANDCIGGYIYEMLGAVMSSPLINVGVMPSEFIMIARNPRHYLTRKADGAFWYRHYAEGGTYPALRIDDVTVVYRHDKSLEDVQKKWELLRTTVNWNHLVFIMADVYGMPSQEVLEEFDRLEDDHLMIFSRNRNVVYTGQDKFLLLEPHDFFRPADAIENHFDLLAWINGLIDRRSNH